MPSESDRPNANLAIKNQLGGMHELTLQCAMKAKIYRNIAGAQIAGRCPPPLRDEVLARNFQTEEGRFTLLFFPMKSPVFAGSVSQALKTISPAERIVAFASCFTLDSLEILKERGAEIFERADFPWTDEGYTAIHTAIASGKKFPAT